MSSWIQEAIDMGLEPDVQEIELMEADLGKPEVETLED